MAHVQIKNKDGGGRAILVDGVDIGMAVRLDGFRIEPGESVSGWLIHCVIDARTLEADLPDAVLQVIQAGDE